MIMNREDIQKAKAENAERIANIAYSGGGHIGQDDLETAFENGAEWRINSVWHDDLKKGQTNRCILVRFRNGLFMLFEDIRELKGIEVEVKMFAYIDDLVNDTED